MAAAKSPVQTLKEAGNTAFKLQDYPQAASLYTQAIVSVYFGPGLQRV